MSAYIVDAIHRAIHADASESPLDRNGDFARELLFLCVIGRKIDAIKKLRAQTGFGLKDSKDFVEDFVEEKHRLTSTGADVQHAFDQRMFKFREQQLEGLKEEVVRLRTQLGERVEIIDSQRREIARLAQENQSLTDQLRSQNFGTELFPPQHLPEADEHEDNGYEPCGDVDCDRCVHK